MDIEYHAFYRPVPPVIGIPVSIVVFILGIVTLPVTAPLHFALRKLGRRGFIAKEADGRWLFVIGPESFTRA